jgi:hypothetical protein
MKSINHKFLLIAIVAVAIAACEKKEYAVGLSEYEHHYYAAYIPNNNSQVSVNKNQAALLKLPVQFYSSFTRTYDAVAHYSIVTTGIANPAVVGQDFNVVDKNGTVIQPVDGKYSMTFTQAKRAMDTIYIKLLNNPTPGTRRMEVQIVENKNDVFYVDIFSTAFRRPVEIK